MICFKKWFYFFPWVSKVRLTSLLIVEKHEAWEEWKSGSLLYILFKSANNLQHKIIDSFLTIVFRTGLQPYMCVITTSMKKKTLQQHKEITLVCEEGIFEVKAISNILVPQSSKIISA